MIKEPLKFIFDLIHDTERLGIWPDTHVILYGYFGPTLSLQILTIYDRYDTLGIFSSPRALFMFKVR